MVQSAVLARVRPAVLVVAVLLAASACGDDSPGRRSADAGLVPPVDVTGSTFSTSPTLDEGERSRPSPSVASPAPDPTVESMPPRAVTTLPARAAMFAPPTASPDHTTTTTSSTTTTTTIPAPTTPPPTTVAPTTAPSTTAAATTQRKRTEPRRVLVIGDSSAAGMRWTGGAEALRGAQFSLDLESCRRLVEASCNGREGYTPSTALDALRWRAGENHDTLIMATGYNDMDRNFNRAFDLIYTEARAQGIETILWTTYREQVGYQLPSGASSAYAEMNESLDLRMLSGEYPELELLDWWGYTRDAPYWLASDGVHFTRSGAFGMADLISRRLAALDGRPCPVPWELLAVPADPCPLPMSERERRGGVPGVELLYGF